jgi:hypothetical protein
MTRLPIIYLLLCQALLAACSIETALPELDYELSDRAKNSSWPRLVDQREFSRDYVRARDVAPEDTVEALQNRVEALRARAKTLQRPVIPPRQRARLQRATTS